MLVDSIMDRNYILDRKKNILKSMMAYGVSVYISQIIGFFVSIFLRRFLGPFYMGVWSLVRVIIDYSLYTHVGTANAMYYKVPLYNGKGEKEEADTVQNVVFSFLLVTSIPVILCMLIAAFILKGRISDELFVGLLILPLIFLGQRFYTYFVMLLRANKKFTLLGKSYIIDSIINLLLVFLLVYKFKLYGMYAASVLLVIFNLLYIQYNARFRLRFMLVWGKIKDYIVFGFPIFVASFLNVMLYSIDRLMIAKMLGMVPLGYYSIAIMSRSYTIGASKSFASVISPYFIEDYGKTEDVLYTRKYILTYTEIIACIMAVILGCVYIVFPVFVDYVIPKFQPGINSMKAMLFSTFFMIVSGLWENFLVVKNRQIVLVITSISAIIMNIILNYILIKMHFNITGVAMASSFTTFFVFITFSILGMYYLENIKGFFLFFIRVLTPLVLITLEVLLIERFVYFANPILECLIRLFVFLICSIGIAFYINRRTGAVNIIIDILRDKFIKSKSV